MAPIGPGHLPWEGGDITGPASHSWDRELQCPGVVSVACSLQPLCGPVSGHHCRYSSGCQDLNSLLTLLQRQQGLVLKMGPITSQGLCYSHELGPHHLPAPRGRLPRFLG